LALESIDATLFLVEREEQRLRHIIEFPQASAEARVEAIRELAMLSSELIAILAECDCGATTAEGSEGA
jgi:hypothetical protein